jgi:Sec-independent protein translocase protein TatA
MNLFNIGSMELIWVFLLALIILGPIKLVQFSKSLGNLLKSSRRWIFELQNSININYKEEENKDE